MRLVRPRKDRRGVDLISDALPFGRMWVWRTECGQQRNRLREALQPLTWCSDSRLRHDWQRDRDARARGRFQGAVGCAFHVDHRHLFL